MNKITIRKIEFHNYRQYGTGVIQLDATRSGELHAFIAKNGIGKTTLLNAITWCLYGKELHLSDKNRALPVYNTAAFSLFSEGLDADGMDNTYFPVFVAISIDDEGASIEFKREIQFCRDPHGRVSEESTEFTVTIIPKQRFENTEIKQGQDADAIVKQYFDRDIVQFYFFDGEKLRDYFAAGQSDAIRASIFNISQVDLLGRVCTRLQKLEERRTKQLSKESPSVAVLQQKKEALEVQLRQHQDALQNNQANLEQFARDLNDINEQLANYEPVRKLQRERTEHEEELKRVEAEEQQWRQARSEFIRDYIVLINLYPRIKFTLDMIKEKEEKGELPPSIDITTVKQILDNPDEPCPLCMGPIRESSLQHLRKVLDQYSVSAQASNYLSSIKGALEEAEEQAKQYPTKRDELKQRGQAIETQKQRLQNRLNEISRHLSNYSGSDDSKNISQLEDRRTVLNSQICAAHQAVGAAKLSISQCQKDIEALERKLQDAIERVTELDEVKAERNVIHDMRSHFEAIKERIVQEMRQEIERITWQIFDSMIWKNNTFGHIEISDTYAISVFNKLGTEMTGSLSATEQMALAYAFTLAIHEASGRNCPLVIDSPLGRVSDENRQKMAEILCDISKTKQIIMLFTPDEYSEPVQQLYDQVATVHRLRLSTDESHVEGMDI